jgi:hypothetical protein
VLYTTWFVCAKELLAESERVVSEPQCHMGADSDRRHPKYVPDRSDAGSIRKSNTCILRLNRSSRYYSCCYEF